MRLAFALVAILFLVIWAFGFFVFKLGDPVHLILLLAILNTIPVFKPITKGNNSVGANNRQNSYQHYDYARLNKQRDNGY
jgi:hypothetical protein